MSHEELTERVIKIIADTQHLALEKIQPESSFQELGIDSLDGINILFAVENEFNINIIRCISYLSICILCTP